MAGTAENPFCVPGYDASTTPLGAKPGDQIAFFVNGMPALLYDVATGMRSTTYVFAYGGGSATLNLIVALKRRSPRRQARMAPSAPQGQ